MSEDLKLELTDSHSGGQMVCPICGETFVSFSNAALLLCADVPLGCVCEVCLLSGPKGAAKRLRARANELRSLLKNSDKNLPASDWASTLRSMWKRIDRWETFAAAIERMEWKPAG